MLEAVVYRGELPRGDVAPLMGAGERHARRIVAELSKAGVLTPDNLEGTPAAGFPSGTSVPMDAGPFPERTL